jgi:hypothetical protein
VRGEDTERWGEETDLDRGHLSVIGEDDDRLQHEPEHVMDAIGAEVLKALSIVATCRRKTHPMAASLSRSSIFHASPHKHQRR